jgi:2-dehydropantoate 2-reductase
MKDKAIAVIGGGAIGGITAAYLSKAGYDVELVVKYKEKAEQAPKGRAAFNRGARRPLYESEGCGRCGAAFRKERYRDDRDQGIRHAGRREASTAVLKDDSLVVSMQNGICVEALGEIVGAQRSVGCVIGWGPR